MDISFKNKVVLVTGSTRNIGKCIAENFARSGASVVINSRHEADVLKIVKEFEKKRYDCFGTAADVSKSEETRAMINRIIRRYKTIDVLVNNAAIWNLGAAENINERDWKRVVDANLGGTFNCCKSVFSVMKKNGGGKIINIGSEAARSGTLMGDVSYVASKAGIIGLMRQLAKEWGPSRIKINTVSLPLMRDPAKEADERFVRSAKNTIALTPLGRLAEFQDVANVVLFLASDKADFITGQTISVNGGLIFN